MTGKQTEEQSTKQPLLHVNNQGTTEQRLRHCPDCRQVNNIKAKHNF